MVPDVTSHGPGQVLRVVCMMQGALLQDTPRALGGPPATNEGHGLEYCRGVLAKPLAMPEVISSGDLGCSHDLGCQQCHERRGASRS